jgi:hypothetical protein
MHAQLVQARQIGKRAAVHWCNATACDARRGNDGQTRVSVPTDVASLAREKREKGCDFRRSIVHSLACLVGASASVREGGFERPTVPKQAERAEARAEQERLAADRFRGEADAARGELAQAVERRTAAEERARGGPAGNRVLLPLRPMERPGKAQEAAEALGPADDARKARGRLRCAWAGWRGR